MSRTEVDLVRLFSELPLAPPESPPNTFVARAIPQTKHKIARSSDGAANLLLSIEGTAWPAPVVLENVSVRYNLRCEILDGGGGVTVERFTVVSCVAGDHLMTDYFLRIAVVVLAAIGDQPTVKEFQAVIDRLVELLRALSQSPTRAIFGLWAELYLMSRSKDVVQLARAWHQTPGDLYDFAAGNQRVEVKATGGKARRHHFALEQLTPPNRVQLLIASIIVERSSGGVSVMDLVDSVRSQLVGVPKLALAVEQIAASTLGADWRNGHLDRFDMHAAATSLRFLNGSSVPRVSSDIPPEVSEVRFVVDLSGVPESPSTALVGELFGCLDR
jgi:putative PD-(D/E)XK family protein DUF4420